MKFGCYTKLIFTIIFIVGVGSSVIDKYVIQNYSSNIKEKIISEFIESNFTSSYKDSISNFVEEKISENKIDFNSLKDLAWKIKDFKDLNDREKYFAIKKLLGENGTQN